MQAKQDGGRMADVDSNVHQRQVTFEKSLHLTHTLAARCPNAKFVHKIRCVSQKQLFFSCCVVCISMTPECWGLYALENKDCIPSSGADRLYTVPLVYRLPARAVTSRSDVYRSLAA